MNRAAPVIPTGNKASGTHSLPQPYCVQEPGSEGGNARFRDKDIMRKGSLPRVVSSIKKQE